MTTSRLNYVRFDVGHYLYLCHKDTIMKFEDSVLAKYISPQFDKRNSELDYIVIDRDGKHFGTILNYMRDQSSLDLGTWIEKDMRDLMREADFYCLTNLVEQCEKQFQDREEKIEETNSEQVFSVPTNRKLEIIFGVDILKDLLTASDKPTFVISYRSMRRFHIENWIEELVKMCDHDKCRVYCFSNKGDEVCFNRVMKDFIITLYEPIEMRFKVTVSAPTYEVFRSRRDHYKCKLFKFWFLVQNALATSSSSSSLEPSIRKKM